MLKRFQTYFEQSKLFLYRFLMKRKTCTCRILNFYRTIIKSECEKAHTKQKHEPHIYKTKKCTFLTILKFHSQSDFEPEFA